MLIVFGLVLAVAPYAVAQTAICTNSQFQWSFNSLQQSPCEIAGYLGGVCNGGLFSVPALADGEVYVGPTLATANSCRCSSVFYSLIAACSGCQSRDFLKWSSYDTNCSTVYPGVFISNIPSGTRVPHYAYLDVTASDEFLPAVASAAANDPESIGIPQSTGSTPAFPSSTALSFPTGPTTKSSSSKAGPIAGGVIGGVAGVALIAAAAFWWTRRRRIGSSQPSSLLVPATTTSSPEVGMSPPPMSFNNSSLAFSSTTSPKPYDPSDPSTFPSAATSAIYTTQEHQPFFNTSQPGTHPTHQGHYTGAPEV